MLLRTAAFPRHALHVSNLYEHEEISYIEWLGSDYPLYWKGSYFFYFDWREDNKIQLHSIRHKKKT